MELDIVKQFNLPSYIKGKSFAEASKLINDKFKDRNDKISMDTKNELLTRLAKAQESLKPPQPESQDFAEGGMTMGEGIGMASAGYNMLSPLLKDGAGKSALSGAMQGAGAGMAAGPLGAVIGGVLGAGTSLLSSNKQKGQEENTIKNSEAMNSQYSSDFAYGGKVDYPDGGPIDPNKPIEGPQPMVNISEPYMSPFLQPMPLQSKKINYRPSKDPTPTINKLEEFNMPKNMSMFKNLPGIESTLPSKLADTSPEAIRSAQRTVKRNDRNEKLGEVSNKLKDIGTDVLRYSPAIMNALQLKNLEKPEYESLDKLGNRYEKDLVDENALRNSVQQEADNTRNALSNAGTGSVAATRAGLLGLQSNSNKALSEAMLNAENINRGENTREQQFNLNVDSTNLGQDNLENDINARNKGQYDTNKSQLMSQLGNDLGAIGKEQKIKQMIKDMGVCYDSRGRYICGTDERVPEGMQSETMAYGGMTNDDIFDDYLSKVLYKKKQ